jgi:ribosomal protein S18 acetylase RimI-like enzyme
MSVGIVKYDSAYQQALIDLWRECNLVVPQNDPATDIQRKLDFQPKLFLIALLDAQLIGSVMAGYEGHRGWLNYLAISPKHQRQGYGEKLVNKAIEELRKMGCLKLNIQVRKSNISAIEFYKRIGFKEDNVVSLGKKLNE